MGRAGTDVTVGAENSDEREGPEGTGTALPDDGDRYLRKSLLDDEISRFTRTGEAAARCQGPRDNC